jgi:hypothetical protein
LPGVAAAYDGADVVDALLDDSRCAGIAALSPYVSDGESDDDPRTLRAHWVAHLSIALAAGGAVAPVLLVLGGTSGVLAPALGFSQKASRRAVSGYVLVDAATPSADTGGADWPDAPVVYLASPAADPLEVNQARLRGWAVHELPSLSAHTIADAILSAAL